MALGISAATWVTAGTSLLGAALQSDGQGDAVDATREGTAANIAEQRRQFDLTRQDYAPYREVGTNALRTLASSIDSQPTAAEVMAQPGYQFGLQQGQQALDRKFAASGGRISGASLKAAQRYGTDYATTGYNAAYQRSQDRLNRLAALAGIGQSATGASAAAGQTMATNVGNALSNQGDTNAAAALMRGNTWANAGNQIAALYSRNLTQQPPSAWTPGYGDGFQTNPQAGY